MNKPTSAPSSSSAAFPPTPPLSSKVETSNSKTSNDKVEMPKIKTVRMSKPIIKEWESDSEDDEIVVKPKEVTKTVKPSFEKIESVNAKNETVRQAKNSRKNNKGPRGNKRNWNGMITQKLGDNFKFKNKTCYVCGSFDHLHYTCKHKRRLNNQKQVKLVWNNSKRVNHQNFGIFYHPNPKGNIVSQVVLTKSDLVSLKTIRLVNTAQPRKTTNDDMPIVYSYYNAYSSVKRPFNKKTINYNRYFNKRVNTVKGTRVNTARPKAEVNTVKALANWVWKPKHEQLSHVSKSNSASKTLTRHAYVDALGLAIPGQTATGKESSNPFMAGSLPKTIHFCDSLPSDEDSFELIELMILCTNFLTMVRDLENLKTSHLLKKDFLQIKRAEDDKEEFGYILLVFMELTVKKLDD
ncbi:hypothetical protein Tco_0536064 [Tanacetum coccineum]